MEPVMKNKKEVSSYVPYRKKGDSYEYYVQKRTADAKLNPGHIGLFGGHAENAETPEEALMREIQEELAYVPQKPVYFSRYEMAERVLHVFIEDVGPAFESQVQISESESARFMTLEEFSNVELIQPGARLILPEVARYLDK
jgi:8-oxo-dGTP pyrophosphatase MutT (NUDIX family)